MCHFQLTPLTPDDAAALAIQLFSQGARLCQRHPNKIARKQGTIINDKKSENVCVSNENMPTNDISEANSKNNVRYNISE